MKLNTVLLIILVLFSSCSSEESSTTKESTTACQIGYIEQSISKYVLPYPPNVEFTVGQGNCTDGSHEINTDQAYAYDFDMPIGTDIVASRAGTVLVVVENFSENNNVAGEENYLVIQHSDTSVSAYYHLTKNGVKVEVGDIVAQGDSIALSGNTGDSSEAHLHFEVARCEDCETLPINFRNTREHRYGLIEGEVYKAE